MRVSTRIARSSGIAPVLLVATACFFGACFSEGALAQKARAKRSVAPASASKPPAELPSRYEVAKGDTLFRIAGRFRPQGVSLNQMVLGLYRANQDAFLNGQINQLVVGRVLTIPTIETLTSIDAAQASQQLKALLAKPAPAPVPPLPPSKESPPEAPPPIRPKPRPSALLLTPEQAAARLQEGIQLERKGDLRAALQAYLASGEAGNGEAQKRLGDIYNTGNEVVPRDYETALKWYQKARSQGVEIPKPITNPGVRH